ncbi:MAG: hypothetical protein OXE44_00280 [Nitrospinae bacterium]|nr:hypothetical protein [Nitrospinota bacterium]
MSEQPQTPQQPETPEPAEPMLNTGLGQNTGWRNNPTAQDLLDHWNDPDVLQQGIGMGLVALSSSDRSTRLNTLSSILQTPTDSLDDSKTLLRNVNVGAMTVIGEREGITYGQWKSGPAGTLDIDFDFRFTPGLDSTVRAMIERSGKSWSWRLTDDFGQHTIQSGTVVSLPDRPPLVLDEDVTTDGIVIFMDHYDEDTESRGRHLDLDQSALANNEFKPFLGTILLAQSRIDRAYTREDSAQLFSLIGHEIAHVIGITRRLRGVDWYEELIDEMNATFTGENAVAANGGNPVPFQWQIGRNRVDPFTPGARVNWGHLATDNDSDSITTYGRIHEDRYVPSELDFAFLADVGYDVLEAATVTEPEIYGFAAWGRYSAWGAGVERTINHEVEGNDVVTEDRLRAGADAFGIAPATSLSDEHGPQGSVTWTGSLIGVDLGSAHLSPVFGDAAVTVDLANLEGTAEFDNLTVVNNGEASVFRAPNLDYAIEVTGNSFSDSGGRIAGGFFGPAHEEMAGVLRDEAPNVNLLGGFGGTR